MPSYEYTCRRCNKPFTVVMSISEHGARKPSCPTCKGNDVQQVLSTFIAKTSKKS